MITNGQKAILWKFAALGIVAANDLLLPPDLIIPFLDELSNENALINGCDLWKFVDSSRNPYEIVQLLDGYLIPDNFGDSVDGSAKLVKNYLENNLPKDVDFVSLIFDDGEIYDYILSLGDNRSNYQPRGED